MNCDNRTAFISRKPHINEFNCWYHFDNDKKDYRITFAITSDHIFETTTDSEELKEFVLKYGIRDEFRPGIYCPETKVRVVTRFKKIVAVNILGFRNSTTNYKATLEEPFEIDINKIYGDKGIYNLTSHWATNIKESRTANQVDGPTAYQR